MLDYMDRLGIRLSIVSGAQALFSESVAGNRFLEDTLAPYGDRFHGYLGFNPSSTANWRTCWRTSSRALSSWASSSWATTGASP